MPQPFYEFLRTFADSMPSAYRGRHDAAAVADHARLAFARGGRARVDGFRSRRGDGAPLCVVADDRPGLLAKISAALVVSGIDVVSAEAYCRDAESGVEAIDLFWVRRVRSSAPIDARDIARVGGVLSSLLDGSGVTSTPVPPVAPTPSRAGRGGSRVRFVLERGALAAVDVEALDRPGLLYALTAALFELRLQITSSELRTIQSRVFDRFHLREFDGAAVPIDREAEIREALVDALSQGDALTPSSPPVGVLSAG